MKKVEFTKSALSDLDNIYDYIAENNQNAAISFMGELFKKFQLLADNKTIGRLRQNVMLDLRSFPHKKYVIFYFPTDEGIEIFRVIHGSRDIETQFDDMMPNDSVN